MNRDEIMNMQPGRELDTLVAEKVMGWHIGESWGGAYWVDKDSCSCYEKVNFKPSQYINIAWEVVEKLKERNRRICLANYLDGSWAVSVRDGGGGYVVGENVFLTAPKAICMAALLCIIQEDTPNEN